MAAAEKKLLRAHVCRVEFRRVCEFVGVFLPSNNPSQGSSVCGWWFFCSPKITMLDPHPGHMDQLKTRSIHFFD